MVTTVLLWEDIEHIDLKMSLKGLMNVPGDISTDVTHVYLDLNFISEIKINAFSHLKMCFLLNLTNNEIHTIENGGFIGLLKIHVLNNNKLTSLTQGMLKGLKTVQTLEICCNKISTIEDEMFGALLWLGWVF